MAEGGGVEPRTFRFPCRFSGPVATHVAAPSVYQSGGRCETRTRVAREANLGLACRCLTYSATLPNLRRTARRATHFPILNSWSRRGDSNPPPSEPQSNVLPLHHAGELISGGNGMSKTCCTHDGTPTLVGARGFEPTLPKGNRFTVGRVHQYSTTPLSIVSPL